MNNYFNPLRSPIKVTYLNKPPPVVEPVMSLSQINNLDDFKPTKKVKPMPGARLIKQFQKEQNKNSKNNLKYDMEDIIERIAREL
jgi:hypothetical protein